MKNWWLNLSLREKQTLSIGLLLISIFLIYEILFAPLFNSVSGLRQKIHTDQNLLAFMQASNQRILVAEHAAHMQRKSGSLFSIVQDDINKNPIAKNISQLQQAENDTVQLHLQKVSFDAFIKWLATACQEHQLIITQLSVTPSNSDTLVDIDLKLALS